MAARPLAPPLAALLVLLALPGRAADPVSPSPVSFSQHAEALLVRLTVEPGGVDSDDALVLELWGDGRLTFHRPEGFRGSRDAETRLTPSELEEVLEDVLREGIFELDAARAAKRLEAARAARRERILQGEQLEITESSDPDTQTLEVRGWLAGDASDAPSEVVRVIRWVGLDADVRDFPEVEELAGLARMVDRLERLATRADLR